MFRMLKANPFAKLLAKATTALSQGLGYTTDPLDKVKAEVETGTAILVDVREKQEWDRGHLRKAVCLPLSSLRAWQNKGLSASEKAALVKSVPEGSVVYCHCAAGSRALPAGAALRKLGYDARPLRQGFRALVEAGFPSDRPR